MNADACVRWIELSDREAVGDPLSADEKAFVREHVASCLECRAEAEVWEKMPSLLDEPVAAHRRARRPWLTGARTLGLSVAAAAIAACFVAWRAHDEQGAPVVAAVPKDATAIVVVAGGGAVEIDGQPGAVGQKLERGAVMVAREGSACIVVPPTVRACVVRGTVLRLADLGAHARLELLGGKVAVELDPLPAGRSFGISTRAGSAIAVGTAFSVEMPPDDAPVITRVLQGQVLVRASNGAEQRVAAHEKTSMRDATPSALPPLDEELDRALLVAPRYGGDMERVHVDSDVPEATVRIDERVVGVAPIELLLTRGEHSVAIATPSHGTMRETLHVGTEPVLRRFALAPAPAPFSDAAVHVEHAANAKSAAELLAAARVRRDRGDLPAAMGAYRELFDRHGGSAEAHTALVPWGELQLSPLSDPREALSAFDRYLVRGGPLEQEASFGRIRALRALGRTADERAAIEAFLRRFPDGSLTSSLRKRLESMAER
ncbi:tetratricopeptide repeat protein [Pendulispora rubella]|uniref:Tetratricopeptide repeat protein n=1 Tax=Pendulispora rubella TaxID=2741070 RepID=A0ABZ2L3J5_9BACT